MGLKPGQKKCITTLDRSLVVAAGAGSGKTFTLTKRIVYAIRTGRVEGIERVCAITFTNKAAGELKSRIKAELRACGLDEQALRVDEAWISTIHGMCARILRAHAVELDLDPSFTMADPAQARGLRDRAIEHVLAQAQVGVEELESSTGVDRSAIDALFSEYPARSYGLRGSSVESMLCTLMDRASSNTRGFDSFVMPDASVNPARLVDIVLSTYEALVEATAAQKPSEARAAWMATVEEQAGIIRDEMHQGNAGDAAWALRSLDRLPMPKRVGTADYKAQVAEAAELYRICVMELRLAVAAPHLEVLVALAEAAQEEFRRLKRADGVLDNNDLLVLASDAVTNYPGIARHYADKFQLVMVDEFQDTDQMQVDMIKKLAGPGACRLCTVGDAQQAIYRFRGADVAVYRRHLEEVRASSPDDVIMLPDNFRSHPDILSLVDRVFEKPDMFGGEFMSLAPGRDEARVKRPFAANVPRIQVQLTSNSYRGASSGYVREVAAARIADAFADLYSRGHSAGEMALLLGGMTYADVYAAALRERGFACVISGGSVFARAGEVQVVLDLARVAANPGQTQALHNVLAGPLFALEAGDLLELATTTAKDGTYRPRPLDAGLAALSADLHDGGVQAQWSSRLALAVRVMGDYLEDVGLMRVSEAIMRVLLDSGWLTRLQEEGPEGLAVAANVYKAVRMIGDIESSSATGPARAARQFEILLGESKEAPGSLSATGGDFVRIMTVHASKGLEFPIVAVAEFKDSSGDSSKLLATEVGGKVYLSLDLGNTAASFDGAAKLKALPDLYGSMMDGRVGEDELLRAIERADGALELRAALYEQDRIGDGEEAKRLLYVALTRAKEALVVSLVGMRTKENPNATPKSCLGAIAAALAGDDGGFAEGVSLLEYGGSAAASVEHVAVQAEDEQASGPPLDEESRGGRGLACSDSSVPFFVPGATSSYHASRIPYAPAHDGVFSYSSVSDSSHEGDILAELSGRFFVSADPAAAAAGFFGWDGALDEGSAGLGNVSDIWPAFRFAEDGSLDDGPWPHGGLSDADSDKATDLGTAFHRLAQYAVLARKGKLLARPPLARIESLSQSCNLGAGQRARLDRALDCWFGSDIAHEMASFDSLRAEVPFFVAVSKRPGGAEDDGARLGDCSSGAQVAYLEGEIDLLGITADGGRAVVVDYKTGGYAGEQFDALARKHVLQAVCYAYAIMLQGVREVESVFVRVERPCADDPTQPQCVRYRFTASDLPILERSIAQAYRQANGSRSF